MMIIESGTNRIIIEQIINHMISNLNAREEFDKNILLELKQLAEKNQLDEKRIINILKQLPEPLSDDHEGNISQLKLKVK